jgi:hypothetical protein
MVIAWWVQRPVFTYLYNPSPTFIASRLGRCFTPGMVHPTTA